MSRINLNKNVFNKEDFLKTVNTSFTQLVPPTPVEVPVMNTDEFFAEYDRLFYEIPKEGATNSHTYLVETSGEYINYERINAEIQALLDEIASLRQELLDLNNDKLDLQLELATINTQNLSTSDSKTSLKGIASKKPVINKNSSPFARNL